MNIVDSKSKENRAVIGDALWNTNFGLNAVYYFKNPHEQTTARIGLLYRSSDRGSVSEVNKSNKFEFHSTSYGVFGGLAGNVGDGFIIYLDIGFGYNVLDTSNYYKGSLPQTQAFPDLNENLEIKSNEVTFIYGLGVEKSIIENRLKAFVEVNGDARISTLNKNNGTYRTQSISFGIGVRYVFNFLNLEK